MRIYTQTSAFDERGFHLDPDATDKNTKLHAVAFKNGIKAKKGKVLNDDIVANTPDTTLVSGPIYVSYDTAPRYVALYKLTYKKAPADCDLYIGFQLSENPFESGTPPPPQDWGIPFAGGFPFYHHVYFKDHKYHVVTAKP